METVRSVDEVEVCPQCAAVLQEIVVETQEYKENGSSYTREIVEFFCPLCGDVVSTIGRTIW